MPIDSRDRLRRGNHRADISRRKRSIDAICHNRRERHRYTASPKTGGRSWIVIEGYSPCPRSSRFLCGSRSPSAAVVLQAIISEHSRPYAVSISTCSIPALSRNAFSRTDHSDIAAMRARDAGSPSTANFIGRTHLSLKGISPTRASPLPKAM